MQHPQAKKIKLRPSIHLAVLATFGIRRSDDAFESTSQHLSPCCFPRVRVQSRVFTLYWLLRTSVQKKFP
jgi:hypothetical protein